MELFKFVTANPYITIFTEGRMIIGATSIMWAERYRDAGEFEIVAPLSSGLKDFLPIGTFISHIDTYEIMVVENQEIKEENAEDPTITITGRSLDSYLENRIVGMSLARASNLIQEYPLAAMYSWNQIVNVINDHIQGLAYSDDNIVNVVAVTTVTYPPGTNEARTFKHVDLYKTVLELLSVDDLGIKSVRMNTFGAPDSSPIQTQLVVHRGVDRSKTVIFSWKSGDIQGADYLWSDKKMKNSALVMGRYVNTVVDTPGMNWANRRSMLVTADDIDGHLDTVPTGTALTDIVAKMQVRGREALKNQNRVTITRSDLANISKYQYRKDFQVGDLIMLDGNFGQIGVMRIIEYVEIQDENGETGHPTLAVVGE